MTLTMHLGAPPTPTPVVLLIGPSASGKSSLVRALHRRGAVRVHPTWTTRPRRADERDGTLEHRFVTDAEFDSMCASDFFWETVAMFGLPHRYGLPPVERAAGGVPELVMLRAPLVERFRRRVPDAIVYLVEGDDRQVERWLSARGCQADDLAARLRDNSDELRVGRAIADRHFRNDRTIEALADDVELALLDEQTRVRS